MPAPTNTQMAADTVAALSQEFVENFRGEFDRLNEILGLFPSEVANAGTALYQYTVTGELNTETPAEGEDVKFTKYKLEKEPIGEMTIKRYATNTTAESIQKGGLENAIIRKDRKLASQLRGKVLGDFFVFLKKGTGTSAAKSLQDALAQVDAEIRDVCEDNGDEAGEIVHFVNRKDAADYLGNANITTQTAFGWDYVETFLGVKNVIFTNKIEAGTVWATPIENIHVRTCDYETLAEAGLVYEVDNLGVIGVHHEPNYKSGSVETHAAVGVDLLPEIKDYIVKGTFGAKEEDKTSSIPTTPSQDDTSGEQAEG